MDDYQEPRSRRGGRARERQQARARRRDAVTAVREASKVQMPDMNLAEGFAGFRSRLGLLLRDLLWHVMNRTPAFKVIGGFLIFAVFLFAANYILAERIFPNVWTMGIGIGGQSVDEAEAQLSTAWNEDIRIEMIVNGETLFTVPPSDLGLSLDAKATVEQARGVGLSGIPLGYGVEPVISLDYAIAQTTILNLTDRVYVPAYEAGYEWQEGRVVGIPGHDGQQLNVSLTLERLALDPTTVVTNGRLELFADSLSPVITDPSPYLNEVYAFTSDDIQLYGYDPFKNEQEAWLAPRDEVIRWLAAGINGVVLREEALKSYIREVNRSLDDPIAPRYIDEVESIEQIRQAIVYQQPEVDLRIRYRPRPYEVVAQDNGFRIGRKTGIPFQLLDEANPGLDWGALSIGQTINLPSRDELLPEMPVANKRIIVDLQRQWLVAYENEEPVFSWGISSGREDAPTYPGVFQILSHEDTAFGSSYALCGDTGCGQWEMFWFMGVYEVTPGLVNGFHGAVLLPNGGYLGGGGVTHPSTFGCVMSENSNAINLYEWAEIGTMVEIVSDDFQPESQLALRSVNEHMQINGA